MKKTRITACLCAFLSVFLLCATLFTGWTVPAFAAQTESETSQTSYAWDGSVAGAFAGGDGSAENPYQIENGAQLKRMEVLINGADSAAYRNKAYVLTDDIYLNETASTGNQWTPIGDFAGTFDGAGHAIYGMYITATVTQSGSYGMFRRCENATLKDFALLEFSMEIALSGTPSGTCVYAGAICGGNNGTGKESYGNTFTGIYVEGTIAANKNEGSLASQYRVGSLLGYHNGGSAIDGCTFVGTVTGSASKYAAYSGFGGGITDCLFVQNNNAFSDWTPGSNKGSGNYTVANGICKKWEKTDDTNSFTGTASTVEEMKAALLATGKFSIGHNGYPVPKKIVEKAGISGWDGSVATAFAGGDGTAQNPYQIATGAQLKLFADKVNAGDAAYRTAHYVLTNNLFLNEDGSEHNHFPTIGASKATAFGGTFDGAGHIISGMVIEENAIPDNSYGFFGTVQGGAVLKNFTLRNFRITVTAQDMASRAEGLTFVGSIFGYGHNTGSSLQVSGVSVYGSVQVSGNGDGGKKQFRAGGLFGYSDLYVSLAGCSFIGTVDCLAGNARTSAPMSGFGSGKLQNCLVVSNQKQLSVWSAGGAAFDHLYVLHNGDIMEYTGTYKEVANQPVAATYPAMKAQLLANGYAMPNHGFPVPSMLKATQRAKLEKLFYGNGTEADPYLLYTADDLYALAEAVKSGKETTDGKYYALGCDISLNRVDCLADLRNWQPIGTDARPFKGTFDGRGYAITDLFLSVASGDPVNQKGYGLFGCVGNATIRNVALLDSYFYVGTYEVPNNGLTHVQTASFVGIPKGTVTLQNLYSDAMIYAGSLTNPNGYTSSSYKNTASAFGGYGGGGYLIDGCSFGGALRSLQGFGSVAMFVNGFSSATTINNSYAFPTGLLSNTAYAALQWYSGGKYSASTSGNLYARADLFEKATNDLDTVSAVTVASGKVTTDGTLPTAMAGLSADTWTCKAGYYPVQTVFFEKHPTTYGSFSPSADANFIGGAKNPMDVTGIMHNLFAVAVQGTSPSAVCKQSDLTVDGMLSVYGAGIRYTPSNPAMRILTSVDVNSEFAKMLSVDVDYTYSEDGRVIFGTLFIPSKLLEKGEMLTMDTENALNIVAKKIVRDKSSGELGYICALTDIPESARNLPITVRSYVGIRASEGGEYVYRYIDQEQRTYRGTGARAYSTQTPEVQAALRALFGADFEAAYGCTIGGVDIGEFQIVLPVRASQDLQLYALELQDYLLTKTGAYLPIVDADAPEKTHEILLGETGRKTSGGAPYLVTASTDINKYAVRVENGKLVFDASHYYTVGQAINLLKTAFGSGVVALPQTYRQLGTYNGNVPLVWNGQGGTGSDAISAVVAANRSKFDDYTKGTAGSYRLVWNDEFDGTAVNWNKWTLSGTMGTTQVRNSTGDEVVSVDGNGNLILTTYILDNEKNVAVDPTNLPAGYTKILVEDASSSFKGEIYQILNDNGTIIWQLRTVIYDPDTKTVLWQVSDKQENGKYKLLTNLPRLTDGRCYVLCDGKYIIKFQNLSEGYYNGSYINVDSVSLASGYTKVKRTYTFAESSNGQQNPITRELTYQITNKNGKVIWVVPSETNYYRTNQGMTTADTMNFMYGYLEMRAMVPAFAKGEWTSFWATSGKAQLFQQAYFDKFGVRATEQNYGIEVDFFEIFSSKGNVVPNLHKWYRTGTPWGDYYKARNVDCRDQLSGVTGGVGSEYSADRTYTGSAAATIATQYHTHGFLWTKDIMAFSVDGVFYYAYNLHQDYGTFAYYDSNGVAKADSGTNGVRSGMAGFGLGNDDNGNPITNNEALSLAIILNDQLFSEAYGTVGTWGSLPCVSTASLFPMIYTVDYMRLYQIEGYCQPNIDQLMTQETIYGGNRTA